MCFIIKNKKIIIRPFKKGDEASLMYYANNKNVARALLDSFPSPYTIRDARDWVLSNIKENTINNPVTQFAITIDDEVIGAISINIKKDRAFIGELGFWLGEPFWSKGIMSEAVRKMTNYGFNVLKLKRIQAQFFVWNIGSGKVLEKCGYVAEGILQKNIKKSKRFMNTYMYSKTR